MLIQRREDVCEENTLTLTNHFAVLNNGWTPKSLDEIRSFCHQRISDSSFRF